MTCNIILVSGVQYHYLLYVYIVKWSQCLVNFHHHSYNFSCNKNLRSTLSNIHKHNIALTIVTMLYITPPGFIYF